LRLKYHFQQNYHVLQDKWKTTVHTVNIAPQQRHDEPISQEFLDLVLVAQAYWAHQHGKLQAESKFQLRRCRVLY
jgi:hypothetical protein